MNSIESSLLAANLKHDANGIWIAPSNAVEISYPEDGNKSCFEIEDNSLWFQHRNSCISALMAIFPPSGDVFDIGGGNGFVSKHLQMQGVGCVLVEPGFSGAFNARVHRALPQVICGTASDLAFLKGRISAVGLFDVLEHIDDDTGFLKELYHLLEPNGSVYLTVPAYAFLWSTADTQAGHYRRYSRTSLQSVLREAGFEIKYCSGIFAALMPAIFIFRSVLSLWGRIELFKSSAAVNQREHGSRRSLGWRMMLRLLERDLQNIRRGRSVIGATLMCVACKSGSDVAKQGGCVT